MKRLTAWILSLALVLSLMPVGVLAEGEKTIPAAHSHSAAQHNCEHCDDAITWTAWDKTDSLPTSGHYYLTADVKPTAQTKITGTNELVLCLNGYTINGEDFNNCPLYVQDTASLTISDCTAYTDAEGVFHAGTFTKCRAGGAMPTAIYAKNNAKVAVYNCIFADGHSTKGSTSKDGQGGAIQVRGDLAGNAPTLHLENVVFDGNSATNSCGALSVYGSTTTPVVTVKKCTFKDNSAPNGGAVYMTKVNATFEECTFTGNKVTANGAGNIQVKSTTAVFDGCTIENNEAVGTAGSAMYIHGGSSKVTLKDTSVVGNRHTGTSAGSRAGIYVTNTSDKLFVTGKTIVKGNVIAADGTPVERNIFVQNSGNAVDVGGLSNGASISVWTNWGTDTTPAFVTAATAPAAWSSAWVLYENNGMAVDYNETDKFHFVENVIHEHCICGVTGCASTEHEKVLFQPWTGKTELPTSGTYYLTEDVQLNGEAVLSEDLTLCLNGHTVTQTKVDNRVISVTAGNVRITGCKGGTITGGKSTGAGGGITANASAAKLELYNITVSGNTAKTNGGGIDIRNGAKLTMSGCTITGNESAKDGAGLYAQKGTEVTVTDTELSSNEVTGGAGGGVAISGKAVLTNVQIKNNIANGAGAGLIVQGEGVVTMNGGVISGNQSGSTGGGIYALKQLTLNGTTITGNTATKLANGVYVAADNVLTLTGDTVIKDNSATNLYLKSGCNVIFDKLTNKAHISISVLDNAPRAITGQTTQDPTGYLYSDSADLQPVYKDSVVYLEAAIKHSHCLCGGEGTGCDHGTVIFAKWDKTDSLPTAGAYYLDCDVVLKAETSISGDLTLCLNGHTVTAAKNKRIMSNPKNTVATIVISDCTASTDANGVYTAGKLTGGTDVGGNAGGGTIYVRAGGVLKFYDGIITNSTSTLQGGAICLADTTKMEMHGGEISDSTAVTADGKTWKKGGAIAVYKAEFTMTAGTIKDTKATNGAISGNNGSTITITGGTICNNWSKADGGGVYVNKSGLYISGTAKIYDNESDAAGANICYGGSSYGSVSDITVEGGESGGGTGAMVQNGAVVTFTNVTFKNNTASNLGGAVRLYKAEATMTDCTITGATAKDGAAVYADTNSKLTINGGKITDNTATSTAGGVRIDGTSSLTLAGAPVISGNAGGNLLLVGGTVMDVSGVTEGAEVYLSADMGPISKPCEDLSKYFESESVYRSVIYKDGALYMATDGSHKHCYCTTAKVSGCDHDNKVEWVAWESTTTLPSSGNYYLLGDIVLTAEQSITEDVSICLNGHTVTAADGQRHISTIKDDAAHIVICDCTATTTNGVYTAGKLTGGVHKTTNTGGGSIYLRTGSSVELFDGIICGNTSDLAGGAIALNNGTAFTMHGGEISGNKVCAISVVDGVETVTWKDGGAIFSASGNDVKILGGTIKNNEANGGGGIRFNGKGNLLIAGGTITGNIGHSQGGGVFASSTTVTITGGRIIGNKTTSSAGGLCLGTGATATMTGGEISGNTANSGGGIIIQGSSTLDLSGGEISNNAASSTGGGIGMYSQAKLTMTGGKISGNTSVKNGAAIYATKAFADLQGGVISNNTGGKDGGAIYVNATGNVDVSGTVLITGNATTSGSGGAISYGSTSTGKISGGTIEKNVAPSGGALMIQNGANVTITDGNINNNTASTSVAGGIRIYKATLTISGGTIQNNTAVKSGGGGIYASTQSVLTISGGTIQNNKTMKSSGGGISAATETVFTMTGGTVKNNFAKTTGGGIASNKCITNISGVTVTGNSCERDGAGIYNTAGLMNIKGGVVSANNYTKGNGGGVCYGSKSSGYISGISIYGNRVDAGGGGMIIQGKANVTIGYASVTGNTAKKTAGGIYLYKATLTMTGGNVSGNTALSGGGGIYAIDSGEMKLSNVTISKNTGKTGGGLYMTRTKLIMKDSIIIENVSNGSGAGVYTSGGTWKAALAGGEFTNVKFVGNQGGDVCSGGAMYVNTDVEVTLTDCEIADNSTKNYCGGIYCAAGAVPTVTNCTFTGNESPKNGGGLYTGDSGTITGCVFKDNKADKGAGLFAGNYMERWHCNGFGNKRDFETGLTITDCTFQGNNAVTDGGGFHLDMSAYTTMDNCTFTGNTAGVAGSAMWLWENCTMTDITVTGNVCANNGHALVLANSEFDGQTYINGLFKMGGDMIVKDNEGGDLYMDYKTTIGMIKSQGYGPKTHMNVTLDEGLLTQRVDGAYNYEGGNLVYTLTYGERSLTDPEYDPNLVAKPAQNDADQKAASNNDLLLYIGIAVIGLAAVAGVVLVILKKKKPASAEQK